MLLADLPMVVGVVGCSRALFIVGDALLEIINGGGIYFLLREKDFGDFEKKGLDCTDDFLSLLFK